MELLSFHWLPAATTEFPADIQSILNNNYETFNGSVTTLNTDITDLIYNIITLDTPASGETAINYFGSIDPDDYAALNVSHPDANNVFDVPSVSLEDTNLLSPKNDPWYYALFSNDGSGNYSGFSFYTYVSGTSQTTSSSNCASFLEFSISGTPGSINYNTNTINVVLPSGTSESSLSGLAPTFSACTTGVTVNGVDQISNVTENNFSGTCVVYTLLSEDGSVSTNWTVCVSIYDPCNPTTSGNTGTSNIGEITTCYSGNVVGRIFYFTGNSFSDYDNLVVGTLRSRGIATYNDDQNPVYEVTGLTDVTLNMSGKYSGVTKNPYLPFAINVVNRDGVTFNFETSFSISDSNYISKVFGGSNFGKPRTAVPLFLEERFQALFNYGFKQGYIRGLNPEIIALDSAQSENSDSIAWYLEKYQTPTSPWVVSELRGSKVYNLFKFHTVSDGGSANTEIKISIADMSFNNQTFTVLVRDFYDTDTNPVVIEKFTNCSMDPSLNNFIAKKIGTVDGEFTLNSKYIMVEMNEDAPVDALPCGFDGYSFREYAGSKSPFPIYKTKYDNL